MEIYKPTNERKKELHKVSIEIIELLRKNCKNMAEFVWVLSAIEYSTSKALEQQGVTMACYKEEKTEPKNDLSIR